MNFLDRFSKKNKVSNTKFHQNPSSESQVVPFTRTVGQKNRTKLIAGFCNFAKAPKKANVKLLLFAQ